MIVRLHALEGMAWRRRMAHSYAIPSLLLVAALLIRSYRLASNPLWLDEIYGYQLARLGVGAILENSRFVPHPPLFYLLQYAASGFGAFNTAWAWRWLAMIGGAASVPLLFLLARQSVSSVSALLVSLLLLISPAHMYYSQESRPYTLLMCLAILTALLLGRIQSRPQPRAAWVGFTALSIAGIWISYGFVMVVGVQLLYLALGRPRWRAFMICAGAIGLSCLPLLGSSVATLRETHAVYADSLPVTLGLLLQELFTGDPLRYGYTWAHTWVPLVMGLLMLGGLWRAAQLRSERASLYHTLQALLPLAGFFGIAAGLLGIRLPAFEWKQFLILLPSLLVVFALGLDLLLAQRPRWGGQAAVLLIGLFLAYASGRSLQQYWGTPKSPEGSAALFVQQQIQPGDAIVSLHYSLDAAVSFYLPDAPVFTKPQIGGPQILFARSASILPAGVSPISFDAPVSAIYQYPRVWLLWLAPAPALVQTFAQHCAEVERHDFAPFQAVLVRDCRSEMP